MTKEERAAEALKKRQQQVDEMRKKSDEERKKQREFLNSGNDQGIYQYILHISNQNEEILRQNKKYTVL